MLRTEKVRNGGLVQLGLYLVANDTWDCVCEEEYTHTASNDVPVCLVSYSQAAVKNLIRTSLMASHGSRS